MSENRGVIFSKIKQFQYERKQKLKDKIVDKLANLFLFLQYKERENIESITLNVLVLFLHFMQICSILVSAKNYKYPDKVTQVGFDIVKYSVFQPIFKEVEISGMGVIVGGLILILYISLVVSIISLSLSSTKEEDRQFQTHRGMIRFVQRFFEYSPYMFQIVALQFSYENLVCGFNQEISYKCSKAYNNGEYPILYLSLFLINIIMQTFVECIQIICYVNAELKPKSIQTRYQKRRFLKFILLNIMSYLSFLGENLEVLHGCVHIYFIIIIIDYFLTLPQMREPFSRIFIFFLLIAEFFCILFTYMEFGNGQINFKNFFMIYLPISSLLYAVTQNVYSFYLRKFFENIEFQKTDKIEDLLKLDQFLELLNEKFYMRNKDKTCFIEFMGQINFHQENCQDDECPCTKEPPKHVLNEKHMKVVKFDDKLNKKAKNHHSSKNANSRFDQAQEDLKNSMKFIKLKTYERGRYIFELSEDDEVFEIWFYEFMDYHMRKIISKLYKRKRDEELEAISVKYWFFLTFIKRNLIKSNSQSKFCLQNIQRPSLYFLVIERALTTLLQNLIRSKDRAALYSYKMNIADEAKNLLALETLVHSESDIEIMKKSVILVLQMKIEWFEKLIEGYRYQNDFFKDTIDLMRCVQYLNKTLEIRLMENRKNIQYLKLLGLIKARVLNDPGYTEKLETEFQNLKRKESQMDKDQINSFNILNGRVGSVVVSFNNEFLDGKILSYSSRFPELMGYEYQEFDQVTNLCQLMPPLVASVHDIIVARLINSGTPAVVRSYRDAFALTKQGHVILIKLFMNYFFLLQNQFAFSGLFLRYECDSQILIIDKFGYIVGINEKFQQMVKQEQVNPFFFNKLHISLFLPQFHKFLSHFDAYGQEDLDLNFLKFVMSFPNELEIYDYMLEFIKYDQKIKEKSFPEAEQQYKHLDKELDFFVNEHAFEECFLNGQEPQYEASVRVLVEKIPTGTGQLIELFLVLIDNTKLIEKDKSTIIMSTAGTMINQAINNLQSKVSKSLSYAQSMKSMASGSSDVKAMKLVQKESERVLQKSGFSKNEAAIQNSGVQDKSGNELTTGTTQNNQLSPTPSGNNHENQQIDSNGLGQLIIPEVKVEQEQSHQDFQQIVSIHSQNFKQKLFYSLNKAIIQISSVVAGTVLESDEQQKYFMTCNKELEAIQITQDHVKSHKFENETTQKNGIILSLLKDNDMFNELIRIRSQMELQYQVKEINNTSDEEKSINSSQNLQEEQGSQNKNVEIETNQMTKTNSTNTKNTDNNANIFNDDLGLLNMKDDKGAEGQSVCSSLNSVQVGTMKSLQDVFQNNKSPKEVVLMYITFLLQLLIFITVILIFIIFYTSLFNDLEGVILQMHYPNDILVSVTNSMVLTSIKFFQSNYENNLGQFNFNIDDVDELYNKQSKFNYSMYYKGLQTYLQQEVKYNNQEKLISDVIDNTYFKIEKNYLKAQLPQTQFLKQIQNALFKLQNYDFQNSKEDTFYLSNNYDQLNKALKQISNNVLEDVLYIQNMINDVNLISFILATVLITFSFSFTIPVFKNLIERMQRICQVIARITQKDANYEMDMLNTLDNYVKSRQELFLHCTFTDYDIKKWEKKNQKRQLQQSQRSKLKNTQALIKKKKKNESSNLCDRIQNQEIKYSLIYLIIIVLFFLSMGFLITVFVYSNGFNSIFDPFVEAYNDFIRGSNKFGWICAAQSTNLKYVYSQNESNNDDDTVIIDTVYSNLMSQYDQQATNSTNYFTNEYFLSSNNDQFGSTFTKSQKKLNTEDICEQDHFIEYPYNKLCPIIQKETLKSGVSIAIKSLFNVQSNQDKFQNWEFSLLQNYLSQPEEFLEEKIAQIFIINTFDIVLKNFIALSTKIHNDFQNVLMIIFGLGTIIYTIFFLILVLNFISNLSNDYNTIKNAIQLLPFQRLNEDQTIHHILKRLFDL